MSFRFYEFPQLHITFKTSKPIIFDTTCDVNGIRSSREQRSRLGKESLDLVVKR